MIAYLYILFANDSNENTFILGTDFISEYLEFVAKEQVENSQYVREEKAKKTAKREEIFNRS